MTYARVKLYAAVLYDEWKVGFFIAAVLLGLAAISYAIGWSGHVQGHGNRLGVGFLVVIFVCVCGMVLTAMVPATRNWWKTIQQKVDERDSSR